MSDAVATHAATTQATERGGTPRPVGKPSGRAGLRGEER